MSFENTESENITTELEEGLDDLFSELDESDESDLEPDLNEQTEEEALKEIEDMNLQLLERRSALSKSCIWKYQEDYFNRKGVDAWSGEVPFYITSNCTIGFSYADVLFRFLQEGWASGYIDPNETTYCLETGTGAGRLSFHILTRLSELFDKHGLKNVRFCYVMTDFTLKNLEFWDQNEQLKPFIEKGYLDFGILNMTLNKGVHLEKKKFTLNKGKCKNPIMVVANYIFDTIPHDAFHFDNGQISEALIDTGTPADNIMGDSVDDLSQLITNFNHSPCSTNHYDDETMNQVLEYYQNTMEKTTLLIPTGAMNFIQHIKQFSNGKLFILSGDKGHTDEDALRQLQDPYISFHGSFSLMVNYHALKKFIEFNQGDSRLLITNDGFAVNMFSIGKSLDEMPDTLYAYEDRIERFSTQEFLHVKNVVIKFADKVELKDMIATLKLSHWDPDIFISLSYYIIESLQEAQEGVKRDLQSGLPRILANYYYLPGGKNIYFELGRTYHGLGQLEIAESFYRLSSTQFQDDWATWYNIGLAQYYTQKKQDALDSFNKALEFDAESDSTKDWIKLINSELNPTDADESYADEVHSDESTE